MSDTERSDRVTRRRFVAAAGSVAAGSVAAATVALPPPAAGALSEPLSDARTTAASLGSGGHPTSLPTLARLAREHGAGEPIMFVDLAAVDQNARTIVSFARARRWAVRPALKVFQCPQLCAYILRLLPQPKGLVFHLRTVDQIMRAAPAGTDLLMGYPPTHGELRSYLTSAPPRGQRRHHLTLLASSIDILQSMAQLARTMRRPLPLSVGLEFDSGEGRGGFHHPAEISAAIRLLRRERRHLRLRAVVCYDGHATASSNESGVVASPSRPAGITAGTSRSCTRREAISTTPPR